MCMSSWSRGSGISGARLCDLGARLRQLRSLAPLAHKPGSVSSEAQLRQLRSPAQLAQKPSSVSSEAQLRQLKSPAPLAQEHSSVSSEAQLRQLRSSAPQDYLVYINHSKESCSSRKVYLTSKFCYTTVTFDFETCTLCVYDYSLVYIWFGFLNCTFSSRGVMEQVVISLYTVPYATTGKRAKWL